MSPDEFRITTMALPKESNTFSFAQMTSNGDGKTSGSGFMGFIICCVGVLSFLLGIIDKMFFSNDIDILTQAILFTSLGAGLLGLRKYKASTPYGSVKIGGNDDLSVTQDLPLDDYTYNSTGRTTRG